MKISRYITIEEATRSNTATRLGIVNTPNEHQLASMQLVAAKCFDPVRMHFGRPIRVTSFFRSPALNKAVGGSRNSQHTRGEAIDMQAGGSGFTNADIFHHIRQNFEFDQLIWEYGTDKEPAWVHVSYSAKKNRKQVLKIFRKDGKVQTVPWT